MPALRVLHVISSLGPAGAERMLYKLIDAARVDGIDHAVVSLTGDGVVGELLRSRGIRVTSLGMRSGVPDPRAAGRLVRRIRAERPNVVQSWMYHADLLAGVAAVVANRVPVVWGIRHGGTEPGRMKKLTRATRAACARLSGILPARIVCCADAVMRSHAAAGYRPDRMVVIPNGFDLDRFAPDPVARARIRNELEIGRAKPVVAMVARFHPDKDHGSFIAAARRIADAIPDTVFVLAGFGVTEGNAALASRLQEAGLLERFRLLGVRSDVASVIAAADVVVQSSLVEGFPNVVGEAMACEVPVAATDCGDTREIVGDTGRVVPPGDAAALARAAIDLLARPPEERAGLGRAARQRVVERYHIRAVARRFETLWGEVSAAASDRPR